MQGGPYEHVRETLVSSEPAEILPTEAFAPVFSVIFYNNLPFKVTFLKPKPLPQILWPLPPLSFF